jgi:hypothetical protein
MKAVHFKYCIGDDEHFEYRIKPTNGKIYPWRVDIWVYSSKYKPLWCCSSRYFRSRPEAEEWRRKQKRDSS